VVFRHDACLQLPTERWCLAGAQADEAVSEPDLAARQHSEHMPAEFPAGDASLRVQMPTAQAAASTQPAVVPNFLADPDQAPTARRDAAQSVPPRLAVASQPNIANSVGGAATGAALPASALAGAFGCAGGAPVSFSGLRTRQTGGACAYK